MVGRTSYPLNCVARWEAEKYCASVGKRLPSSDEWEYAARSGYEHWDCAPGVAVGDCAARFAHGGYGSDAWRLRDPAVCKIVGDTTEQGVCDFGHFNEWVADEAARPGIRECRQHHGPTRGSGGAAWDVESCAPIYRREWDVAFRCARSASVNAK